jgi:hypothetical protein
MRDNTLLPRLAILQQNLRYYVSLANFYTVHALPARCWML